MLKRIPALALIALASTPTLPQETAMSGIIPYDTHVETLSNGLKVILIPMADSQLVAYWSIVRTGSRDEVEPGRSGFAHFFEHMMFRGTEKYPADAYYEALTTLGADGNAFTTDDLTAYYLSIAADDLGSIVDLESDRFQHLSYADSAFRTEAGAVYGEYRKNRTNPLYTLYEAMTGAAFEVHPYGHMVIGYEADIAAMPELYEYSRSFFAHYYRPDNTILFIAGDVDPTSAMTLIEEHYGGWEAGYVPPVMPTEPAQQAERRVDVSFQGRTLPYLWVAYKFDSFDPADPIRVAAELLVELAFGSTSEIYRQLVLEEQVVEFLQAEASANRDPTLLNIYARVKDPERVEDVLAAIDATIASFQAALPDGPRLTALKSRLKYEFLMGLETPESVARQLARYIAISGGLEDVETLYRTYDAITANDIRRAAQLYLKPERRTIAVLRQQE